MTKTASCILLSLALSLSSAAQARNTVVYFGLDPGYEWYSSSELIIDKDASTSAADQIPASGFMPRLRLGFNAGGYGGGEAFVSGHWWGGGDQLGGGGVAGGLLRITPLEFFKHLYRPLAKRPVDLGLSFGAGYSLVGEDFAYQGWFMQYGFDLTFYVFRFFSIGFELPIRQMLYAPFRYTNFKNNQGLCTRGGQAFGKDGREVDRSAVREVKTTDGRNIGVLEVDSNDRVTGNYILTELDASEMDSYCGGPAPEVWQFAPMLTLTFLVDFGV